MALAQVGTLQDPFAGPFEGQIKLTFLASTYAFLGLGVLLLLGVNRFRRANLASN